MSVKHSLLALIYEKPRHGYELKTGFDELVENLWPLNTGQVYTTLDRLERDELVISPGHDDKGRKLYAITNKGKEELWKWMQKPVERSLLKNKFYFKYLCASYIDYDAKQKMIKEQQKSILSEVLHLTHLRREMKTSGNDTMVKLIDGALLHLEADKKWLDLIGK